MQLEYLLFTFRGILLPSNAVSSLILFFCFGGVNIIKMGE